MDRDHRFFEDALGRIVYGRIATSSSPFFDNAQHVGCDEPRAGTPNHRHRVPALPLDRRGLFIAYRWLVDVPAELHPSPSPPGDVQPGQINRMEHRGGEHFRKKSLQRCACGRHGMQGMPLLQ